MEYDFLICIILSQKRATPYAYALITKSINRMNNFIQGYSLSTQPACYESCVKNEVDFVDKLVCSPSDNYTSMPPLINIIIKY